MHWRLAATTPRSARSQAGYLSSSARTPFFTIVALFAAFALLSVAFWAYFRNKPPDAEPVT